MHKLTATLIIALSCLHAAAQTTERSEKSCMKLRKSGHLQQKPTVADAEENSYDVSHVMFQLNMTDTSTYINGSVRTTASVTAPDMSRYVFELSPLFTIDSVKINGALRPVTSSGTVRRVTLASPMTAGTVFTAQVYYRGAPAPSLSNEAGLIHATSTSGTHNVFSTGEARGACNWWPCKQSLTDKTDSADMYITVPDGVSVGSNGLLQSIIPAAPGFRTFHWKTNYPTDYYLLSVAVARYSDVSSYMHFTGSSDSMLVQNYIMDSATFMPTAAANLATMPDAINFFSGLWGRYPFWKEKYGNCFAGINGGLEHQTMSTVVYDWVSLLVHELAHQWFGDNVTQKSWADIWITEGFATYGDLLYSEYRDGAAAGKSLRLDYIIMSTGSAESCSRVYVSDTTVMDSIFNSAQYQKACLVIGMLRLMAPEDSLFFKGLRTYQTTYAGGTAGTEEFKSVMAATYGFSLDEFFNQWVYGRGYPIFSTSWNQVGNTVFLKLVQTQSCPSYTNHFSVPVEVRFTASGTDTVIRFLNTFDTQVFSFDWDKTVTGINVNWWAQTLMKMNTPPVKDPGLTSVSVADVTTPYAIVFPNPTHGDWEIASITEPVSLTLSDVTGKIIWQQKSHNTSITIPGSYLPSGTYMLTISGTSKQHLKLVRW